MAANYFDSCFAQQLHLACGLNVTAACISGSKRYNQHCQRRFVANGFRRKVILILQRLVARNHKRWSLIKALRRKTSLPHLYGDKITFDTGYFCINQTYMRLVLLSFRLSHENGPLRLLIILRKSVVTLQHFIHYHGQCLSLLDFMKSSKKIYLSALFGVSIAKRMVVFHLRHAFHSQFFHSSSPSYPG